MRILKSLDSGLSWIENIVAAGALAFACGLQIVSVIMRNLGAGVIFWAEEATIYAIIFSTFFGAVVVLRHNEHVNVDILAVLLHGPAKKAILLLGALCTVVYAFFVVWVSWELIGEPFSRTTLTPALKLPLWVVELSIAVGMTLFLIRAVEMAVRAIITPAERLDRDVLAEEAAAAGLDADLVEAGQRAIASGDVTVGGLRAGTEGRTDDAVGDAESEGREKRNG
ncbi:TRAP transporter small permease [Brevibacterium sp.]|uniref:TRAP transporter small permease n=1 Tax=Brevibacterium sp. TaxID=1701 RepID=UPI0025BC0F72|nr:TRAP transporter small permease [Brevibacterium sp.]